MLGNVFHDLPQAAQGEVLQDLLAVPGLRIERIVSHGQASPEGFWYDQDWDEWVLVLQGLAVLELEGRTEPLVLSVGDYCWLPAHCRHRVAATAPQEPTIWLAVHREPVG